MELQAFVRAVRKSWWLIALGGLLAAAVGGALALNRPPTYATTVTFFAATPSTGTNSGSPYAADQFAQQRVNTYVNLLTSDRLADLIQSKSNVDESIDFLQSCISGESQANTVLLTATVVTTDPALSNSIAEAVSAQFPSLVKSIEGAAGAKTPLVTLDVVDGPSEPVQVGPPVKLFVALGAVVGLAIGVALSLLRELTDTTVRSVEALQRLTQLPVLAAIVNTRPPKRATLVITKTSSSVFSEAFRQLRTNLQFVDVDRPNSVIVATSAVPNEGKSTTATNLAITFAEAGRSVILIDADLRRPRLADLLGLEGNIGLTNVLVGQVTADEATQSWGHSGLAVLVSGSVPPNPSELLGSDHMLALLTALKRKYDMVIIDTPPLLPVTDAAVVAANADGAVVMVRYGSTRRSLVTSAISMLAAVNARMLGTVLTFAPPKGPRGRGAYHGYNTYVQTQATYENSQLDPLVESAGVVDVVGSVSSDRDASVRSTRARASARLGLRPASRRSAAAAGTTFNDRHVSGSG